VLDETIVKLHRLAVHGGDPLEEERCLCAIGAEAGTAGELGREADALEAIEIEMKHVGPEVRCTAGARGAGKPGALAPAGDVNGGVSRVGRRRAVFEFSGRAAARGDGADQAAAAGPEAAVTEEGVVLVIFGLLRV